MSAEASLRGFMRQGRPQEAARLLGGLLRGGGPEAALRLLRRSAGREPRAAWPLILEAAVHQKTGDWSAARLSLEGALRLEPSAGLHAELARVLERLGILPDAIRHAGRAVALERSVEHHSLKAELHVRWRESDLAVREYDGALELAPGRGDLLFQRAKAHSTGGRLAEAIEDAEAACRAEPDDQALLAWTAQLLTQNGQAARAARRTAALEDATLASFCRAYAHLHARRYGKALEELEACRRRAGEGALGRKASFYETIARLADFPAPRRSADFSLIGLGVEPPYSATAQCLRVLSRCDVVFNNVMGDELFELLRLFCGDCRPLAYHQNNDEGRLCDLMMAEARRGRRVGFVTRGSAIVYGPLGAELLRRCRAEGLSWSCLAGVSSAELINAKFPAPGSSVRGAVVLDSKDAAKMGKDPGAPTTVYLDLNVPDAAYQGFCAGLVSAFGKSAPALVLDHVIGQQPLRLRTAELRGLRKSLSPSAIFQLQGGK
jgi:tetratricopeptide (TPR) repeat protein